MKIIKLSKRHKLYQEGYTHALRSVKWEGSLLLIERKMGEIFGTQYDWRKPTEWRGTFGSKKNPKTGYRPYYIAVRNESYLTMALLTNQDSSK